MTSVKRAMLRLGWAAALTGAGLVAGLLLVEVTLRAFPSLISTDVLLRMHWDALVENRTPTVADPSIGFRYPPNTTDTIDVNDVQFTFTTDEHGFRNPSPWPDEAEIVTVGDSMTFGYGVSADEPWPNLLAGRIRPNRVINLALSGMAPQQYFRAYSTIGAALHPKLLIVGLFPGNDLDDVRTFDAWVEAGGQGDYNVWRFGERGVPGARDKLRDLLRYTRAFVRDARRRSPRGQDAFIDCSDGRGVRLSLDMQAGIAGRARPGDPGFERVMEVLRETRAVTERNGTHLLVLLMPTKETVYGPLVGSAAGDEISAFRQALEGSNIEYLDATPTLQERARGGECLYFTLDGHPNPKGYAAIADLVLRHLERHGSRYGLRDW